MILGFDAKRLFNNDTGLGNYSRTLVESLKRSHPEYQYHLFCPKVSDANPYLPSFKNYPIHMAGKLPSAYWRTYGIKNSLRAANIQLYHGLSQEIPLALRSAGIKSVVTIHDLIIYKWPNTFRALDRFFYHQKMSYACKHADHVIAISESTKKDIQKYYDTPEHKISVVYQSCADVFKISYSKERRDRQLLKYNLPQSYMLYVGSVIERKNLLRLIQAVGQLPKEDRLPLVVVGRGKGAYMHRIKTEINRLKLNDLLFFLSYGTSERPPLSHEDLPLLYQGANLFCYPSIYEGFGIPVLEALYSKVPVLTSTLSSLPEVGGSASFYVDPMSVDSISDVLKLALTNADKRNIAVQEGYRHAMKFDATNASNQLVGIYKECLSNS